MHRATVLAESISVISGWIGFGLGSALDREKGRVLPAPNPAFRLDRARWARRTAPTAPTRSLEINFTER